MNSPSATHSLKVARFRKGAAVAVVRDLVAVEAPMEIRVEGHSLAVLMRTPGRDRELTAGFLLSEGVIRSSRDLFEISLCGGEAGAPAQVAEVHLRNPSKFAPEKLTRHLLTSSSCGVCSQTLLASVLRRRRPLKGSARIAPAELQRMPGMLREAQAVFAVTGGLHACALVEAGGDLVEVCEDVGRHNALDKLIGNRLLNRQLPLDSHVLLLSGRTSFEMVQKAYAAGIVFVAAIGAPSSLAVDFARKSGQTLVGFLREDSFNTYSGSRRLQTQRRGPGTA